MVTLLGLNVLSWVLLTLTVGFLVLMLLKAKSFWQDFGVSAFLAITMTVGVLITFFGMGVWKNDPDNAIKLSAPLLLVLREFVDKYFQKRREDNQMRHEKEMAELSKPPVPP